MSYSRWDKSVWYTYWATSSPDFEHLKTRELRIKKIKEQVFRICMVCDFTYNELVDDLESCLETVKNKEPETTDEQLTELKGYIQRFISDMNKEIEKI